MPTLRQGGNSPVRRGVSAQRCTGSRGGGPRTRRGRPQELQSRPGWAANRTLLMGGLGEPAHPKG